MPKINPIQASFSGGELSPRFRAQTNSDKYANSLAFCENFVPTPYGSLEMRSGFQHIGFSQHINPRLFSFERGLSGDVIVEIGPAPDGNVVIWDRSGVINVPAPQPPQPLQDVVELFTDRAFAAGPSNWRRCNRVFGRRDFDPTDRFSIAGSVSADFSGGRFQSGNKGSQIITENTAFPCDVYVLSQPGQFFAFDEYRQHGISQRVTTPSPTDDHTASMVIAWNHQTIDQDQIDVWRNSAPPSSGGATTGLLFTLIVSATEGGPPAFGTVATQFKISAQGSSGTTVSIPTFVPNTGVFYVYGYFGYTTGYFDSTLKGYTPPGFSTYAFYWHRLNADIRTPSCSVTLVDEPPPIEPDPPEPWDPPWTQEQIPLVKAAQDSARQIMIFVHPEVRPLKLFFDENAEPQWDLVTIPDGDLPDAFGDGNWPGAVCFHQGRLWFGGTPNQSSSIWGSEVGVYENFDISASPDPTHVDPVEFNVATSGAIFWMASAKDLIIGCDKYEIIGTAIGGHIWTEDYNFAQHSAWGTDTTQGVQVANEMLTVSGDSARIRSFQDTERINGYETNEASIFGEHLILERVLELDYAGLPYYMLSCLTAQGRINAMTYDNHLGLAGWYRIRTDGTIYSQAVAVDRLGTSLWVAVSRPNGVSLEVLNYGEFLGFNLDSFVLRVVDEDQVVSGLEHLEGVEVGVVIYGAEQGSLIYRQHPDVKVEGGQVQLEEWAEGGAAVGLPYTATARTLPPEGFSGAGTSQSHKRRWSDIRLRLVASAIPTINGEFPPDRHPATPMDLSEPLITGDIEYGDLGYADGVIEIVQSQPLRTEIAGIFGTATGNKL